MDMLEDRSWCGIVRFSNLDSRAQGTCDVQGRQADVVVCVGESVPTKLLSVPNTSYFNIQTKNYNSINPSLGARDLDHVS